LALFDAIRIELIQGFMLMGKKTCEKKIKMGRYCSWCGQRMELW